MEPSGQWFAELPLPVLGASTGGLVPTLPSSLLLNSLILPPYIAALSVFVFLCQLATDFAFARKPASARETVEDHDETVDANILRRRFTDLGGASIFVLRLMQVLAVLGLLGLSVGQLAFDLHQSGDTLSSHYADTLIGSMPLRVVHCALYVRLRPSPPVAV